MDDEYDEPQTYDDAVHRVHRAFCDPEHELVGPWDQEMAAALKRNGYRIVKESQEPLDVERLTRAIHEQMKLPAAHATQGCLCGAELADIYKSLPQWHFESIAGIPVMMPDGAP